MPVASSNADPRIDELLSYWLGAPYPTDADALARQSLWFTKSAATDAEIGTRFGPLVEQALAGTLDGWAQTPRGRLALIVLLDQFTRNLFRGTAKSFAGDAHALQLALDGILEGHDVDPGVPDVARIFFYLPLEHAEDGPLQEQSVALFKKLHELALPQTRSFLAGTLDYAHRHQEVIKRFGRFPHRNPILGRESTPAELEYLAQPGSGF
ncbi:DUF924 family protein [Comamonas endophytica]|uniref:DUF924 domain-containing protein n=1 Tax=Comamonas endophytica TaxID=2949090 RepID=A0ABY6G5H6_9BURK|nr:MULTISPECIES: DUF924 family protein [unclassified Acidovorax]MCD2512282.1 DUF924 domain-containing protein [Acidovorax sp. D4N7]UYG50261.1 DUF924 domain-containing protein [Acidovorax sp. 5MLIR]